MTYDQKAFKHYATRIKGLGFTVYASKSGTHGLITDDTGERALSFSYGYDGLTFSGNYKAVKPTEGRLVGTGWRLDYGVQPLSVESIRSLLYATAPRWATGAVQVKYSTIQDQLDTYGKSSGFQEVAA